MARIQAKRAYEMIRDFITGGDYEPGQALSEQSLASSCGMSRTPVREALLRLLGEGFVERESGRGFSVARISLKNLQDAFDLRMIVEPVAAARAAKLVSFEQKKVLAELAPCDIEVVDGRALRQVLKQNLQFHVTIARASQNLLLAQVVRDCLTHFNRLVGVEADLAEATREATHAEHMKLFDAIVAGDPERAHSAAERHVADGRRRVMDAILGRGSLTAHLEPMSPSRQD